VLLWDAGLPEPDLLANPMGRGGWKKVITSPLVPWLAELGFAPAEVTHLGFSHLHIDHAGNASMFESATVFLSANEQAHAFGPDHDSAYHPQDYNVLRGRPTVLVEAEHDVFGDGSVVIHAAPGHTPGHQMLAVTTDHGPVLLVGDAYYRPDDLVHQRIARWNCDIAESFRTLDRIERLVADSGARLFIHHDPHAVAS
jgi:glyoxylase-like metal-dependent hydrolase (beta-lactamase superfamily II)